MSDNDATKPSRWDTRHQHLLRWISVVVSSLGILAFLIVLVWMLLSGDATQIHDLKVLLNKNFAGTIVFVGILAASFAAVTFLRQSEGPVEFEGLGFKFKGAAGQVVLWCLCCAVLSACARLLWVPVY